jgi:hypothetical protein
MTDDPNKVYTEEYVEDARLAVHAMVKELELLVRDLLSYAENLPMTVVKNSRLTPAGVASDIVGLYLSRIGNGGVWLGELVSNAGKAEAHRAQISHEVAGVVRCESER